MTAMVSTSFSEAVTGLDGRKFCSYRVGGPIDLALMPTQYESAVEALKAIDTTTPLTVLGGGCNTLIASRGIRGATLITKRMLAVEVVDLASGRLRFDAGVPLARVATTAQDHGFSGAEFMIGIPGTVGGAIAMNAGAMGQSTDEIVEGAVVYDCASRQVLTLDAEALAFSYRHSSIDPQRHVVLAGYFRFKPGDAQAIAHLMQQSLDFRKAHHPKEPNGGSVFKNPAPGHPAGRLLDELGAKTWREGGARISELHANFIVNDGSATSTDVLRLMLKMKTAIEAHYPFKVYPENRFVGQPSDEEARLWAQLHDRPLPSSDLEDHAG
ncbi:MAG: UDP-N-acetylmuramate dehydrogenase [Cyanobacteria bacterium HKST-UBA06]|nr:UDP-N-acetylmuramate dehydrogenase [Cyanobacteria bacterium HKST-UBA06]